jgi:hypothetical protein
MPVTLQNCKRPWAKENRRQGTSWLCHLLQLGSWPMTICYPTYQTVKVSAEWKQCWAFSSAIHLSRVVHIFAAHLHLTPRLAGDHQVSLICCSVDLCFTLFLQEKVGILGALGLPSYSKALFLMEKRHSNSEMLWIASMIFLLGDCWKDFSTYNFLPIFWWVQAEQGSR